MCDTSLKTNIGMSWYMICMQRATCLIQQAWLKPHGKYAYGGRSFGRKSGIENSHMGTHDPTAKHIKKCRLLDLKGHYFIKDLALSSVYVSNVLSCYRYNHLERWIKNHTHRVYPNKCLAWTVISSLFLNYGKHYWGDMQNKISLRVVSKIRKFLLVKPSRLEGCLSIIANPIHLLIVTSKIKNHSPCSI